VPGDVGERFGENGNEVLAEFGGNRVDVPVDHDAGSEREMHGGMFDDFVDLLGDGGGGGVRELEDGDP